MSYTKHNWENAPSKTTPINAQRLNEMEQGIYDANQPATTSKDGLMSSTDKSKLNSISNNAKNVSITVTGEAMTISIS